MIDPTRKPLLHVVQIGGSRRPINTYGGPKDARVCESGCGAVLSKYNPYSSCHACEPTTHGAVKRKITNRRGTQNND